MTKTNEIEPVSLRTLEELEARFLQVEHLLDGEKIEGHGSLIEGGHAKELSVQVRVARIEASLHLLALNFATVSDILELYERHPDLYPSNASPEELDAYTSSEKRSIVNACATVYPTTVSRLTSVQDLSLPSTESLASLSVLQPRIARAELLHTHQLEKVADLRSRSAAVLQRWYSVGILGRGECWAEWEDRLLAVEKTLRRREAMSHQE